VTVAIFSRRSQDLNAELHRAAVDDAIHLIVDSRGLSIVGEGEWAAPKHGGRGKRGWEKPRWCFGSSSGSRFAKRRVSCDQFCL
jgi:hypothetical protein